MKICLVGGVYDNTADYRQTVLWTPETTLETGLAARGHDVVTLGHKGTKISERFDVIHVHHLGRGAIAVASDVSQTPFVFTNHNTARSPLMRLALRSVMARADGIVALSAAEAARERRNHGLSDAIHVAIPNGVDGQRFATRVPRRPERDEPWRLLFAGQLIRMKRVDLLFEAVSQLRERLPIRLKLAYHVDREVETLRLQAQRLGIGPIVEFAGPLTQSALASAYREAHMLVLPSENDSLPSVITEAMMSGTPVVATEVGSVANQLDGYGVLVRAGSADSLAAGIQKMISEYDVHCDRSLEMSRSARERFSVEAMIAHHEAIYRAVATTGRKVRRHLPRNLAGTYMLRRALKAWNRIHPQVRSQE